MRALEFTTTIKDDKISLPIEQKDLMEGKQVRVILLIENQEKDENSYQKLAKDQFLSGYAEEDNIYDKY